MLYIPAGYAVEIVTWENDGDSTSVRTIYGLTKKQSEDFVDLARHFEQSFDEDENSFGNMYCPDHIELSAFDTKMVKLYNKYYPSEEYTGYEKYNRIVNILEAMGICTNSEYFTRMVDGLRILYFESDVYATLIL